VLQPSDDELDLEREMEYLGEPEEALDQVSRVDQV